jgi:tetratricopeptide (TPR) repeat protein
MKDIHDRYHRILSEGGGPSALFPVLSQMREAGDTTAVIRGCTEALSRFPGDIRILRLMAEVCLETGRLSLAESQIEKAADRIEELIPAYRLKAQIHLRGGRPDDARKALGVFLAHRPEDPEAVALLEELERVATPPAPAPLPEAEPEAEAMQGPGPEAHSVPEIATPTLAEVYFGQGQLQEAAATYERYLSRNPQAEQYRQRLEEIQAMISRPPAEEREARPDPARVKRERMVNVLETWRSRIREAPYE